MRPGAGCCRRFPDRGCSFTPTPAAIATGCAVSLAEQGISAERVEFVDLLPTAEYFGVYQRIDVALDPFPYGGGTTTCDALWMGVPVVSLAGKRPWAAAG